MEGIDPYEFLPEDDVGEMAQAMVKLAELYPTAPNRRDLLEAAGVRALNVNTNDVTDIFATSLVAEFRRFCVSDRNTSYHPMINILAYLLRFQASKWENEAELFTRLLSHGQERLKALAARRSVAKIEDEQGHGIGTGTLVAGDKLLSCYHIITKSVGLKRAFARFDFRFRCHESAENRGSRVELDLVNIIAHGGGISASGGTAPDYVLLTLLPDPNALQNPLQGRPAITPAKVKLTGDAALGTGTPIRTIHHPGGRPAVISDRGRVVRVGSEYIAHNLATEPGSSGAPIFDSNWQLVAIHQGDTEMSNPLPPGTTGGIPVYGVLGQQIQSYLN